MHPDPYSDSQPTNRKYDIKCQIKVIHKGFKLFSGRQTDEDMVILIPEQSSEMEAFLDAWLPITLTDQEEAAGMVIKPTELLSDIKEPFQKRARLALCHRDQFSKEKHYLMVMTHEVEEKLLTRKGEKVLLRILPESVEVEEVIGGMD